MRADRLARPVELAGERPVEDLGHERALAAARDAGHRDERAERDPQVDVAEVVLARAAHDQLLAAALATTARDRDRALPAEEGAGDGPRLREDGLERPVGDDLAAVLPRPGPDVDDPVRGADGLLVVLDDEDRVAQVAEPGQRRDQLGVVALVQADRRLVQDVQHAHERRADLRREADPLGLAARQRDAGPVHRQVVEPDVDQEPEPCADLLDDLVGDRPLALGQRRREAGRPAERRRDRHRRDVPDVPVADGDRQDLRAEPLAAAGRARPADHELLELGLDVVRIGLAVAALEVRDHALERRVVRVLAALVAVADDDLLALGRAEHVLDRLGRQVRDRARRSPSRATRRWPRGSSAATTRRSASAPTARARRSPGSWSGRGSRGPGRSRGGSRDRRRPGTRRAAS